MRRGVAVLAVGLAAALVAATAHGAPPPGATAQCVDGSYSYSRHHAGTCSHHGGVAVWLDGSTSSSSASASAGTGDSETTSGACGWNAGP